MVNTLKWWWYKDWLYYNGIPVATIGFIDLTNGQEEYYAMFGNGAFNGQEEYYAMFGNGAFIITRVTEEIAKEVAESTILTMLGQ